MSLKEKLRKSMDFKKYCSDNGLSFDAIMKLPSYYNDTEIGFQVLEDFDRIDLGLADDKPAKVILIVKKEGDRFIYEPSDDIKDYVGVR